MKKEEQLAKNTAILTVGTLFTKILAFIVIPLFSSWLSVSDYGKYDLYNTYITLLIPILTLSCGEAVFRFLLDTNENIKRKSIVSSAFFVALLGIFIGAFIVPSLMIENTPIKIAFLLLMVFEILNNFLQAYIRGLKKLKYYAISSIIVMIFGTVFVTVFVFFLNMELQGILLGYALAYLISCIYLIVSGKFFKYISLKSISKKEIQNILYYSMPLIPNTISWWIMNVSDRSIIKLWLGSNVLGIYSIACTLPSVCTTLFGVFQFSWQQSVSETIEDKDKEIFYSKVLNKLIMVTSSIAIAVLSVNFIFFKFIFDPKYIDGYWSVGILMAATVLSSIAAYFGGIFIGQKNTKHNGATTAITALINVVVHLSLVKFIGIYAASVSTFVSYLALVIIRVKIINRTIKLKIDNETKCVILILTYYCIIQYFPNTILELINVLVASIIFLYVNKNTLIGILKKLHSYKK